MARGSRPAAGEGLLRPCTPCRLCAMPPPPSLQTAAFHSKVWGLLTWEPGGLSGAVRGCSHHASETCTTSAQLVGCRTCRILRPRTVGLTGMVLPVPFSSTTLAPLASACFSCLLYNMASVTDSACTQCSHFRTMGPVSERRCCLGRGGVLACPRAPRQAGRCNEPVVAGEFNTLLNLHAVDTSQVCVPRC